MKACESDGKQYANPSLLKWGCGECLECTPGFQASKGQYENATDVQRTGKTKIGDEENSTVNPLSPTETLRMISPDGFITL